MDVPLYGAALVTFGVLYLVLDVYLAFAILISLIVVLLYLALRYGKLPDDYPHGPEDTLITAIFVGVTWGLFTWLGPKSPIPWVGIGLTYTNPSMLPLGSILTIALVLTIGFLALGAFVIDRLQTKGRGGPKPPEPGQPQSVGAG